MAYWETSIKFKSKKHRVNWLKERKFKQIKVDTQKMWGKADKKDGLVFGVKKTPTVMKFYHRKKYTEIF